MRSWNVLNIQGFCRLFLLRLFLLNLLVLGNLAVQCGEIDHIGARQVHQIFIIYITVFHCIKAFLHTIRTNMDIIGQADHRPGHTLRPPAQEADLFILIRTASRYPAVSRSVRMIIMLISHNNIPRFLKNCRRNTPR